MLGMILCVVLVVVCVCVCARAGRVCGNVLVAVFAYVLLYKSYFLRFLTLRHDTGSRTHGLIGKEVSSPPSVLSLCVFSMASPYVLCAFFCFYSCVF